MTKTVRVEGMLMSTALSTESAAAHFYSQHDCVQKVQYYVSDNFSNS